MDVVSEFWLLMAAELSRCRLFRSRLCLVTSDISGVAREVQDRGRVWAAPGGTCYDWQVGENFFFFLNSCENSDCKFTRVCVQ